MNNKNDLNLANKKALKMNFLQNINLKEIFSEEELDLIISEFNISDDNYYDSSIVKSLYSDNKGRIDKKKKSSFINSKKLNEMLFDRIKFILNILKISCDKLKKNNFDYLAKGLDWYYFIIYLV